MKLHQTLQAIAVTASLSIASVGISATIAAPDAKASSQDVIFINNNTRSTIALQLGGDRFEIGSGISASYPVRSNTKLCLDNAVNRTKQECFQIRAGRSYTVIRASNGSVKLLQLSDTFVVRNN
ncbi:hypothetical protein V2H45_09730 [Tumidithrix elongata RA019]|uniref:Uncharacterized protein n=1 Tax=Tumidithrix elongata BACA0141 TaxID=2716417 RepID=A0AAW9PR20_9CYAN|nr:hypothetical protein [Tumidithrix elongata RA019]